MKHLLYVYLKHLHLVYTKHLPLVYNSSSRSYETSSPRSHNYKPSKLLTTLFQRHLTINIFYSRQSFQTPAANKGLNKAPSSCETIENLKPQICSYSADVVDDDDYAVMNLSLCFGALNVRNWYNKGIDPLVLCGGVEFRICVVQRAKKNLARVYNKQERSYS